MDSPDLNLDDDRVASAVRVPDANIIEGSLRDGRKFHFSLGGGLACLGVADTIADARLRSYPHTGGAMSTVGGHGMHTWPSIERRNDVFTELLDKLAAEALAKLRTSVLDAVAASEGRTQDELAAQLGAQVVEVRRVLDEASFSDKVMARPVDRDGSSVLGWWPKEPPGSASTGSAPTS